MVRTSTTPHEPDGQQLQQQQIHYANQPDKGAPWQQIKQRAGRTRRTRVQIQRRLS
jgi:hypothetical protein